MFKTILRILNPLNLVLAVLVYVLGSGMGRYFSIQLNVTVFIIGLVLVLLFQSAVSLLASFFQPAAQSYINNETPRQRVRVRQLLLQISAAILTFSAGLVVYLLYAGALQLLTVLFLLAYFLLLVLYAVPPFLLAHSGYGEIVQAIIYGSLIPGLGFLLQNIDFHRLLPAVTFPLTLLALSYFLVTGFPSFAADQKIARRTLLIRMTWQRAVPVHHLLILSAYALFAVAPYMEFPWALFWPAFLTLPLGILQIFWLRRVALGGRPVWRFLIANAVAIFGLTAYSLALTFWIR